MLARYLLHCLIAVLFALTPTVCFACEYPVPPSFAELMALAKNVGILRIVSSEIDPNDRGDESVIAHVRRIETLRGKPYDIRTIRYNNGECGGHRLDVGQYYLLVSDNEDKDFDLVRGGKAVLSLWAFIYLPPEYWTQMGRLERDSGTRMSELRLAIAGKGKLPEYETSEGLVRMQTIPPPPPCVCSRQ